MENKNNLEQKNVATFLKYSGTCVAASITYDFAKAPTRKAYFQSTCLIYSARGVYCLECDGKEFSVSEGGFCLIRKYTEVHCFNRFEGRGKSAEVYAFLLSDDFIRRVIADISIPSDANPVAERFISVVPNDQLRIMMSAVSDCMFQGKKVSGDFLENKTLAAIQALLATNPGLAGIFKVYTLAERADIEKLVSQDFLLYDNLEHLAKISGRSLSTFNREFRLIFNEPPHRWLKRRRLEFARKLMKQNLQKPSEVYLVAGFETLAHFSRSFKNEFGIAPSYFYQNNCQ